MELQNTLLLNMIVHNEVYATLEVGWDDADNGDMFTEIEMRNHLALILVALIMKVIPKRYIVKIFE